MTSTHELQVEIAGRALAQAAQDLDLAASTLRELRDAAPRGCRDRAAYRSAAKRSEDALHLVTQIRGRLDLHPHQ